MGLDDIIKKPIAYKNFNIINNIPIYIVYPNDLYINIRRGDIFIKAIHPYYFQPPLCFFQKIITENKYDNIFLLSNGHENPFVDSLLKLYHKLSIFMNL